VDDLDSIVIAQLCREPVAATYDGAVQLHGDSRSRQIELSNEVGKEKWTGELSGFAIYVNAQFMPRQAE
jgi:hypothetical protein